MTTMPGDTTLPTSTSWEDLDRRHLVHPQQAGQSPERLVVVEGRGSTVRDVHGREYLDICGSANWTCQVGHAREELVTAVAEQSARLAYFSGFFGYSNDQAIRLAERLVGLAPDGFDRVFFTCGGSEGVETAMKAARLYHHHRGEPERTWFLSRQLGYHGSTFGSGTLTGFDGMSDGVGPVLPHVAKVSPPYPYRADELYGGADPTDFLIGELRDTIERIGPDQVAAMIGEPVIGGGGILVPPPDYWPRVRELLTSYGILLIADEVVTGFGRLGSWFDSAERGMDPDLIVTAKGLTSGYAPLGAVLLRDAVADTVAGPDTVFGHGHTYSAHPAACAVALANLDVLEKEDLVGRAREIGDWFRDDLAPLAALPHVGDVRVAAAMAGIELVTDRGTKEPLMGEAAAARMQHEHGIILRAYGPTLVLSPPLVVEREQVRRTASALADVLSRLRPDGSVASA